MRSRRNISHLKLKTQQLFKRFFLSSVESCQDNHIPPFFGLAFYKFQKMISRKREIMREKPDFTIDSNEDHFREKIFSNSTSIFLNSSSEKRCPFGDVTKRSIFGISFRSALSFFLGNYYYQPHGSARSRTGRIRSMGSQKSKSDF